MNFIGPGSARIVAAAAQAIVWDSGGKSGNITLSPGNLIATCGDASNNGVRATQPKSTGKWYAEVVLGTGFDGSHNGYLGLVDTVNSSWGFWVPGTSNGSVVDTFGYGLFTGSTGYFTTGSFATNTPLQPAFTDSQIWAIAVDFDAGKVWLSQNNSWTAFKASSDPATGANHILAFTANTACHVAAGMNNSGVFFTLPTTLNFTPPSGFTAWA